MSFSKNRKLIIIEEVGDIKVSAAIANWNLAKIIGGNFDNVDVLTMDNISSEIRKEWVFGDIYVHNYKNLKKYQIFIMEKMNSLNTLFKIFSGNDFHHFNRIKNIRSFLNKNKQNYKSILCLSGGLGFATHQAIFRINFDNDVVLSGVFHDPYPASSYPVPYQGGNRFYEFFKRKNLQKSLNKLNYIIYPSKKLYEWYLKDYEIEESKVRIIPHAVDFHTKNKEVKGEKNKTTITHAGTLLKPRNPTVFLETFVKNSNDNLNVEFYGPVNDSVYNDIMPFKKYGNILISNERIPYALAQKKLYESDFLFLIESDAIDNPFLPTKFVDYVVIGLPIIVLTSSNSEVARLLGTNYPFMSELNDKEKIALILKERITNEKYLDEAMGILEKLKDYFSKDNIISSYKSILN